MFCNLLTKITKPYLLRIIKTILCIRSKCRRLCQRTIWRVKIIQNIIICIFTRLCKITTKNFNPL